MEKFIIQLNAYFDFYVALNVAVGLLCFQLPKRSHFAWRYIGCLLLQLIFPLLRYLIPMRIYVNFGFTLQYLVMIPMILFCFKASVSESLFCSSIGLCLQHSTIAAYFCLQNLFLTELPAVYGVLIQIAFYCVNFPIFYVVFVKKHLKKVISFKKTNYKIVWLIALVMPAITFLCLKARVIAPGNHGVVVLTYSLTFLISIIGITAEIDLYLSNQQTEENISLTLLLKRDGEEYQKLKRQIETVSIRYHDLRHKMEAEETAKKLDVNLMEEDDFETGDLVLNYVLMQKKPLFVEKNVRLTCFADGLDLKYMKEMDKYSLFENAVMNAYKAVEELDEEKRTISIVVYRKGAFYNIGIENYYRGGIVVEDGLPVSQQSGYGHGYGLKSMRAVVKSYGGRLDISFEGEIFTLNILLPTNAFDGLGTNLSQTGTLSCM